MNQAQAIAMLREALESAKRTRDNFCAWYRHYRGGHVLVLGLGRWESFWRPAEWVWKERRKK